MFHAIRVRVSVVDPTGWTDETVDDCFRRLAEFEPSLLVDLPLTAVAARHAASRHHVSVSCRGTASDILRRFTDAPAPTLATVVLRDDDELATELFERIYDAGSIVVMQTPDSVDLGGLTLPSLWERRSDQQRPISFTVNQAGCAERASAFGDPLITSAPVWELSVDQILAQLELSPAPDEAIEMLPSHDPVTLVDGRVWRRYALGGTMALGHQRSQAEGMAALGFEDEQSFRAWANEIQRDAPSAQLEFPSHISGVPFGGAFVGPDGGVSVQPAPKVEARIILAAWLASGDFENARALLGLGASRFDRAERVDPDHLPVQQRASLVSSSRKALAEALFVLSLSGLPRGTRTRVASLLPCLGLEHARHLARHIVGSDPEFGQPVIDRFGSNFVQRRLKKAKSDIDKARGYVDEVLGELETIFGGAK